MTEINKDMMLGEIIEKYPETVHVFLSYGLHCIGCHLSPHESLEAGCRVHGMNDDQINKLLSDCNELIKLKSN